MSSYVQLFCLIFSFLYGMFIYVFNKLNLSIIRNKNILVKLLISILYVFNASLLYVVILYIFNNGIIHIYFILFILLGYGICVKKRK